MKVEFKINMFDHARQIRYMRELREPFYTVPRLDRPEWNLVDKERVVYVDGDWVSKSQASVSVYDHGFLYGDGVFEGIRAYDGVIFRFQEHLDRLYNSAKSIKLQIPLSPEEMTRAVVDTLKRNDLNDAYIRLIVTRGVGDLSRSLPASFLKTVLRSCRREHPPPSQGRLML